MIVTGSHVNNENCHRVTVAKGIVWGMPVNFLCSVVSVQDFFTNKVTV